VLEFERPVTALAATPDGRTLLVAAINAGVSAWHLPEGSLILGFDPPPPITVPDARDLQPHPEGANAVAVSPDGRQALVALENRLLLYDVASGRLVRELPAQSSVVRGVAWSPDGSGVLVTTFYDPNVRLLRPDSGLEWGRLSSGREAASAAFSPDGRQVAVGGESGALALSTPKGDELRTLTASGRAVAALAFGDARLVAGRDGGMVEIWNIDDGRLERQLTTGTPSPRLAIHADRVAITGAGGVIQLVHLTGTTDPEIVNWHQQELLALAWAGTTLVSGDAAGRVALWTD
jgi:WD40 repeat protein